jgi:hypothetical protein|tara:strand:- start:380 stop:499 length:120 start_codon:yes stop_codon:yes gene_type:complete
MWELLPMFAVFYVLGMLGLAFYYRIKQNKNEDENIDNSH